jgi:hypothetical protein
MRGSPIPIRRAAIRSRAPMHGVVVGTLRGLDAKSQPLVSFPGAPFPEVAARIAAHEPAFTDGLEKLCGRAVLLAFEDNDGQLPLIIGLVRETVERAPRLTEAGCQPPVFGTPGQPLTVNGRALVFDAQDEIVFRCGLGSITIRADGSIVIKGTRLLSRASEVNKIRGASVQIN